MNNKVQNILIFLSLILATLAVGLGLQARQSVEQEAAQIEAAPAEDIKKVVYHVDFADPGRLSAMMTSINNMTNTYQEKLQEYDVRIVFVAHGIRFLTQDSLKGTPFAEDATLKARKKELINRLTGLNELQEVKLELCEITREAISLDKEKLIPGVELVQSGVVRLAELQEKGFAYLKIQ